MATFVTTVLTFRGQAGGIEITGDAQYAEIYQVTMSDVNGTGIEAIAGNPGIPTLGYQFDPINYPSILVRGMGSRRWTAIPNGST